MLSGNGADTASSPHVAQVMVGASPWSGEFRNHLAAGGLGTTGGYAVPTGESQYKALPWTGLDQIKIKFDRSVDLQQDDLTVTGVNVPAYSITGFSYDAPSLTATWTLGQTLGNDRLTLRLDGHSSAAVSGSPGRVLDGDWTNKVSNFPSGDGAAGGDFSFRLNSMPGDVNQDRLVDISDLQQVAAQWMQADALTDANADGIVNDKEVQLVSANWLQSNRPPSTPTIIEVGGEFVGPGYLVTGRASDINGDGIIDSQDLQSVSSPGAQSSSAITSIESGSAHYLESLHSTNTDIVIESGVEVLGSRWLVLGAAHDVGNVDVGADSSIAAMPGVDSASGGGGAVAAASAAALPRIASDRMEARSFSVVTAPVAFAETGAMPESATALDLSLALAKDDRGSPSPDRETPSRGVSEPADRWRAVAGVGATDSLFAVNGSLATDAETLDELAACITHGAREGGV